MSTSFPGEAGAKDGWMADPRGSLSGLDVRVLPGC